MGRGTGVVEMGREAWSSGVMRRDGSSGCARADSQSHIHMWGIKVRRDTLGASDPSPRPDCTAEGSSARKMNPHNFWL